MRWMTKHGAGETGEAESEEPEDDAVLDLGVTEDGFGAVGGGSVIFCHLPALGAVTERQ